MLNLCATGLLGLLALQGGAGLPSSGGNGRVSAAEQGIASTNDQARTPAPVRLAPVPGDTSCVFFDEGEMRARLLDPDLVQREKAYEELVLLARKHAPIRNTIAAWAKESGSLEVAWTARLVLRELRKEYQALAGDPRVLRVQVQDPSPFHQVTQRELLLGLGYDPDEYRIRGMLRLSPEEAARMDAAQRAAQAPPEPQPDPGPVEEVLGVVCDERAPEGVILTRVVPGSIADAIGLEAGDRLERVGELVLSGPADIGEAMHRWNSRGAEDDAALEVIAIDGRTGEQKVRVWVPGPGR